MLAASPSRVVPRRSTSALPNMAETCPLRMTLVAGAVFAAGEESGDVEVGCSGRIVGIFLAGLPRALSSAAKEYDRAQAQQEQGQSMPILTSRMLRVPRRSIAPATMIPPLTTQERGFTRKLDAPTTMRITGHDWLNGNPFSWSTRNRAPATISARPMVIRWAEVEIANVAMPFSRSRTGGPKLSHSRPPLGLPTNMILAPSLRLRSLRRAGCPRGPVPVLARPTTRVVQTRQV